MEAIVLAGGFGTRLRHVVPDVPKPMAPVAGRPFLEILLQALAEKGFTRVVLSLGYLAESVLNHFGHKFAGMDLIYEIEQTPLGTGGALRRALNRCTLGHVFVLNGDTYLDFEVDDIEGQWKRDEMPIIVAREVPDASRFGRLDIREGRVVGFLDKGVAGRGLINAGCYVFPKDIARKFPDQQTFSLESDFLAKEVTHLRFDFFLSRGHFIDIGVPEDYVRAQSELTKVCG